VTPAPIYAILFPERPFLEDITVSEVTIDNMQKLPLFGTAVAADGRRMEFNIGNESLIAEKVKPYAVFIGDSITHIWELQAYFGGSERIIVNRGIGGDISDYVRKRFTADTLQLKPELIVMLIGTNDMGWMLEQLDETITDRICENIKSMVKDAVAEGIKIAVASVLPIWGPSWYPVPEFVARKNAQIVEANRRLNPIVEENGGIYVDYHSKMLDENGILRKNLAEDGVHPQSEGYSIMATTLRETLAAKGITI
jgi:lysophospholipase L1-like esterase